MKEVTFLNINKKKWEKLEAVLARRIKVKPDELSDLYTEVVNDLAYAQTFFPASKTTRYLNAIASRAHQNIYRNRKEKRNRVVEFWKFELPQILNEIRRFFWYSLSIFVVGVLLGWVSSAYDSDFIRIVLGDRYVNMTLDNIEQNDPMGVYASMTGSNMFVAISFNNIRVAFLAFVAGVLFSIGTGYVLFSNGMMVGVFHFLFYKYSNLPFAMMTIWIHGTIEIFVILMAGAAGMTMGHGFLFPGTYKRIRSFRVSAIKGIKIVVGLVPFFIVAAFLEGFVTRHSEYPTFVKLGVIAASLSLIVFYFFIYPRRLARSKEALEISAANKNH